MSKRKFYAVRPPIGPVVVESWEECAALVHGVSGARYKSFVERRAAEEWLCGADAPVISDELRLYVDGSFVGGVAYGGWGIVAVKDNEELWRDSGVTAEPALSRNIDGEVEAAARAIEWVRAHPQPAVVCHDYEGIARWATGDWKAKSAVAQQYLKRVLPLPAQLRFEKVAAHSGEKWNDLVDELARSPLFDLKKTL